MSYELEIKPGCKNDIRKYCRKNRLLELAIGKKVSEVLENPKRYKHLRYDLKQECRVHILKSFVLKYEVDDERKTVILVQFGHHDEAYER